MNCKEFEREWQELEDTSEMTPVLEKHRQDCPACAEMIHDLQSIIQQARRMLPLENPSEGVWPQIRQQLESERMIPGIPQRRFSAPQPMWAWLPRLAYAAVFLMVLGGVYLLNLFTNTSITSSPSKVTVAQQVPAPIGDAAFRQMVDKIPPERRAVYETHLNRVNSSIAQLTTFIQEHPEDPSAREQLFNAYEHRERLWETMVKWQEF